MKESHQLRNVMWHAERRMNCQLDFRGRPSPEDIVSVIQDLVAKGSAEQIEEFLPLLEDTLKDRQEVDKEKRRAKGQRRNATWVAG